jgi:U3 small nucleolar RNA-associated protein 3
MAKRKRGGHAAEEPKGPSMEVGKSKMRIRDYEDVADSDDEFHLQRDRVLLGEEPEVKRRRKLQEQEEFLQQSDEEVLDYSDEGEDEDEDEDEEEDDANEYRGAQQNGSGALPSGSEEDGAGDEGEDELDGWGTSKADLYGADEIETEEQALEEEAEALRLQKKQLQQMSAADFAFDGNEWQEDGAVAEAGEPEDVVTQVLPQLQITEDMGPIERLNLLKSRYPEFEPLSKELLALRDVHAALAERAKAAAGLHSDSAAPTVITKFRAASAYLGALTMYFTLLSSTIWKADAGVAAMSASKLRDHPVMESLVQCRDVWQKAKSLPEDSDINDDSEEEEEDDVSVDEDLEVVQEIKQKKPKKSRAQRHAEAAQAAAEARKAERLAKTEAGLADLDALIAPSASTKAKSKRKQAAADGDSDMGEEAPLTAREAEEKAKRKKSLRFYTSQIAQKANKRGASGRNAGGDEDVPHRERLKDRQARLNAEAEKRGRKDADAGAELDGISDEEDDRQAKAIRAEADEGDYYDMVAARTAKKKADKLAFAEAQKKAALEGGRVVEAETVGPDGKRKISYAIEKNKGLTPFRKKDVRNPRVKKRKKFEEKKKKLASMKPVYKGGQGRGGYGGELTGIKKGLVKSTKLG